MNLILLCRGTSGTKHVALSPALLAMLGASVSLVLAAALGLGYGLARSHGFVPSDARIATLQREVAAQAGEVTLARQTAADQVTALTRRVGDLNAQVIRLNALGSQLAGMAKLDNGEFDFSARPAVGGPEGPSLATGGVPDLLVDLDDLDFRLEQQSRQLAILGDLMVERKLEAEARPQGRPVRAGYISSYFGRRVDPFNGEWRHHRGLDFSGKAGTEIVSVASGVVTWSGARAGYGRMVEVTHGNGYVTRYAHNARNLVAVGDHVQKGDTIALIGSTGRATGPHLHFEVWHKGRPVDPGRYIRQTG
jgi:murein DD-endopeptidase MepM/ murein hydrolase activator NlpD